MGVFNGLFLTTRGKALQAKAQAGATLHYTRIGIGDGSLAGTPPTELTQLISEKKSIPISKLQRLSGGKAVVGGVFTNTGLATGFYFREFGVYAQDPDLGEILYCYGNAGSSADFIPPDSGSDVLERHIAAVTIVGNAQNVTATIDQSLVYATLADLQEVQDDLASHRNATLVHGATDAATPNRIARRDANGQFEVGAPTAANHVARKVDLDEVKQSVSDGKNQIASAITGMGQTASGSDTFAQLSSKIRDISKDANAAIGDVLTGKTFYQGGVKRTGTMANRAGSTVAPTTKTGYNGAVDFKIPAGYYDSNSIINGQDANFTTGNIKAGVTVFGMTGVFTDDANAAAADILSGKTAYVKGSKVTGSMPVATDRSAPANTGTDGDGRFMVAPAKGYWDGGKWVKTSLIDRAAQTQAVSFGRSGTSIYFRLPQGVYRTNAGPGYPEVYYDEPNLVAGNIKSGINIFGLIGSLRAWNGEKRTASGSGTRNSSGQLVYQDGSYYTQVSDWPMFKSPNLGWSCGVVVMTTTSTTYGENFLTVAFNSIVVNRYSAHSQGGWTGVMINLNVSSGSYIIFNTTANGSGMGPAFFHLPHMHSRIDYWQAWEL